MKRPMPAQKPTTHQSRSPLGCEERRIRVERITDGPRAAGRTPSLWSGYRREGGGAAYVGNGARDGRAREVWQEVAMQARIPIVHQGLWVAARRPESAAVLEAFPRSHTEIGTASR